jgi:hypothetical protein
MEIEWEDKDEDGGRDEVEVRGEDDESGEGMRDEEEAWVLLMGSNVGEEDDAEEGDDDDKENESLLGLGSDDEEGEGLSDELLGDNKAEDEDELSGVDEAEGENEVEVEVEVEGEDEIKLFELLSLFVDWLIRVKGWVRISCANWYICLRSSSYGILTNEKSVIGTIIFSLR